MHTPEVFCSPTAALDLGGTMALSSEPESDAPADSSVAFAADLRQLRLAADQPTLDRLVRETHVSRTVLSETFNGRQVPSARTVDRLVRALGADPAPWLERREQLAEGTTANRTTSDATDAAPRTVRRRTAMWLMAAALVVGGGVGAGIGFGSGAAYMAATPLAERTQIVVQTGLDPAKTACVNDAAVVVSEERPNNTRIDLIWSNKCNAGWGRVSRYDANEAGEWVTVTTFAQSDPQGPDTQTARYSNVKSAYTPLLVRPGDDMICTSASITVDGVEISLGEPLCT